MSLLKMEEALRTKVQDEYNRGYKHVKDERERKRSIMEKVLNPTLAEGLVRVNLLWRNIQLELALFLTDEIGVKFLASEGITGEEIMNNANVAMQFDDMDMDLREQREAIVNYNGLYGLAATVIDSWDNTENQPISDTIDPLTLIIDPNNYSGSKVRFIGVERRVPRFWLEETDGFELEEGTIFATSEEMDKNKRSSDLANNLVNIIITDDGLVDIYDHFTVYKGKKYLSTWVNSREKLVRLVELEGLTEAEKLKPSKVKFPIQLHRRKPKLGSVFGVAIADEVMQFQDAISTLTNLQLKQSYNLALGADIFVDERLGIDTSILAESAPGGRIIPVTNDTGLPTQNGIYTQQLPAPNPFIGGMISTLKNESEGTTNVSQQSFGVSQGGTQTKAEIQTLQQNANQILIWIANNYLQGQKEYWEAHYRSYCLNMGDKASKQVSVFQKGNNISRTLKREDFISDGKVNVFITSKSQETAENEKEFNKLLALANIYLGNMKQGYSMNDFLRLLGRKTNIRDFDETRYIAPTIDELEAMKNLPLLNKNIEVPGPMDGQDYLTYVLIYRQALKTPAAIKALKQYEEAYTTIQKPAEDMQAMLGGEAGKTGVANPQTANTALNNLNQGSSLSTGIATM